MSFIAYSQFTSLAAVAQEFQIQMYIATCIAHRDSLVPGTSFLERLPIILAQGLHKSSEAARCEMLIAPILYEVWQEYRSMLKLWSYVALDHDSVLCGTPKYLIAKQSELGVAVLGKPILVAIEAKQDDFELGWGQMFGRDGYCPKNQR